MRVSLSWFLVPSCFAFLDFSGAQRSTSTLVEVIDIMAIVVFFCLDSDQNVVVVVMTG